MNIGIIGAGWIAAKLARTLKAMQSAPSLTGRAGGEADCVGYAIAARDLERAERFAAEWGFTKAYGSYEELVSDPQVDLVYIATGYEYEILACRDALANGWTECPAMPLDETLEVMRLMDRFRHDCGVIYPMDLVR